MKTNTIKDTPDSELQLLLDSTNSLSAILRELKLSETCPHNRKLLKKRMESLDLTQYEQNKIDKNPFCSGVDHFLNDDDYFKVGTSRRSGNHIKLRLYKHKGWKEECSICKSLPIWQDKPLSLHLDHINGNGFDNRIENLRLLCPNCHSQTETYGGKNKK